MKNRERKKTVYVGLSGGVDSSVSAALLKKQGYDVTGVFIKVWDSGFTECNWKDEMRDAMRVCAVLDIPFVKLDLSREYKREVIDYMIREYKTGRTPNPDVMCNRHIKFGAFFDWAMKRGADYVATGHYARIMNHKTWNLKQKRKKQNPSSFILHVSSDCEKDQSYFLWTLKQKHLARTLFPVGGMTKLEVRKLAKNFGLFTAEKKDSQGLCFIGKISVKDFLKNYAKTKPGKVLDTSGRAVGEHQGAIFYTIGERHGFTVTDAKLKSAPCYVVAKDKKKNTITVSHKSVDKESSSGRKVFLRNVNWISGAPPRDGRSLAARIRYRAPLAACRLERRYGQIAVIFKETIDAAAPGQSIVFYKKNKCLGGGIINIVI